MFCQHCDSIRITVMEICSDTADTEEDKNVMLYDIDIIIMGNKTALTDSFCPNQRQATIILNIKGTIHPKM